ncbi:hypothetical protein [Staphylococcus felis]|uniref:hypothetical protein n=1 Tax=Staphylococcus felis TaxID=46127 RepID=UPI0021D2F8AD|nr:hypothetical protein [Staphylococcus felis]UXR86195.1 hypothetical protein MUA17_09060 [Staphylococcus felis]UXR87111.1 hypothetical protein MUA17_01970 [Staphylococcus felis]
MFNLYDERRQAVVVVTRGINDIYIVKGLQGTQLEHISRETDDIDEFKATFNLFSYEELGQLSIDELIKF